MERIISYREPDFLSQKVKWEFYHEECLHLKDQGFQEILLAQPESTWIPPYHDHFWSFIWHTKSHFEIWAVGENLQWRNPQCHGCGAGVLDEPKKES